MYLVSTNLFLTTSLSPGGWLIAGSAGGEVIQYDSSSGKLSREYERHSVDVTDIAFSADGNYFITTGYLTAVSISRYDGFLFTGSTDTTVIQWDIKSGNIIRTVDGRKGQIAAIAISPSTGCFVTSAWNIKSREQIKRWDNETLFAFDDILASMALFYDTCDEIRTRSVNGVTRKKKLYTFK